MKQAQKFYNYLEQLSEQSKNPLVEGIKEGFKIMSGYNPMMESDEESMAGGEEGEVPEGVTDGMDADGGDGSNGVDGSVPEATDDGGESAETGVEEAGAGITEAEEAVDDETKVVKSETLAPELIDKVSKLCTEILALYKQLSGVDFIKEEEHDTKEKTEETPNSSDVKEVIMEDVNLKERRATGDYTGTDYSKIFETLFAFLDEVENHVESMYRLNNVEQQDQIIAQTIPHIDKILNTYKAEFQQLEEQHMDDVLPVMRTTIVNAVTKWVQILKKFDIKLNQHHEISGYYGRYVVAKFITDVVTPAINYSDMIRGQATMNADKLQVNVKAVMDKINTLIQTFNADVESDIKSKTGGKAYTKGTTQAQPQPVSA